MKAESYHIEMMVRLMGMDEVAEAVVLMSLSPPLHDIQGRLAGLVEVELDAFWRNLLAVYQLPLVDRDYLQLLR